MNLGSQNCLGDNEPGLRCILWEEPAKIKPGGCGHGGRCGPARTKIALQFLLCLLFLTLATAPVRAADGAKKLVALVDYIGGDYKNAVRAGKVVDQEEYQEMKEFSSRSLDLLKRLKAEQGGDPAAIEPDLKELAASIENKGDEKRVADLARGIKEKLLATYKILPYPKSLPSLQAGKAVFAQNCAQCHGETGKGDGPSRATMKPQNPPPANFTDPELMAGLSPFKAFNTASFGVEGTAMADFSALSEEERWAAAFYIFSLRFSPEASGAGKRLFGTKKLPSDLRSAALLSTLSDEELKERLKAQLPTEPEASQALAYLRRGLPEERSADPLIVARTLLGESMALYEKGQREKADQKAVDAYLDGFELAEPALFARDPSFGRALESQMTRFRNLVRGGAEVEEVQRLYREIDAKLLRASQLLGGEDQLTGAYLFLNAALIILREGLEAALILAAILALLRVMKTPKANYYIHLGWTLALAAGLLTWFLAQTVLSLSGSHREIMEGFTTLLAALVLFYMGYWLHTKSEAQKWQAFIRDKVQEALSARRILALVGVSFFAVYREAFEVVLFYQALLLQSPAHPEPVLWGFAAGALFLSLLAFVLFRLGLKIPVKYFFGATGFFLYLLAFAFVGQGVKELQAAGWVPITPLSFPPQASLLGIYPTLETLLAQGVMLLAVLSALFWMARQRQMHLPAHSRSKLSRR